MITPNKIKCKTKLHDRDFLFGIFARQGFVKDTDDFLHKDAPEIDSEDRGDSTENHAQTCDTR